MEAVREHLDGANATEHTEAAAELVSEAAGLAYPIRDGVPVMLVEEARRLTP